MDQLKEEKVSEFLLKVRYIILVVPNVVEFLISNTVFCFRMETLPYVWKYSNKTERHLCLIRHSFTKLSQNVYINILVYQYARCDCKLWNALRFYCVFWVFSYIFDNYSCLNCCICTELSLIVYLINNDMSKCQM